MNAENTTPASLPTINPPAALKALTWANKHKTVIALIAVILGGAGYATVSMTSKAPAHEKNDKGVKETDSFVIQSGKEAGKGWILNSEADFKSPTNKKVWLSNKGLLPMGLSGVQGKKVHVYVPVTVHPQYGAEYVVNTASDWAVE